jgi:hypothetical protein
MMPRRDNGCFRRLHPQAKERRASGVPKANSMRKIFLIVGIAIVVFMAFTAYSVQKAVQGNAQLAAIKDCTSPSCSASTRTSCAPTRLEEMYIQVVIAGDRDMIEKAAELGGRRIMRSRRSTLYPGRESKTSPHCARPQAVPGVGHESLARVSRPEQRRRAPMTASMNERWRSCRRT